MNKTMSKTIRYTFRTQHAADDFSGRIDVTTTETLTEIDGGVQVDSHSVGVAEGARVDAHSQSIWPGVTMAAAMAYRDARRAYTRIR